MKAQLRDEMRSNATPSPTDSNATTHESNSSREQTPTLGLDLDFMDDDEPYEGFDDDGSFSP